MTITTNIFTIAVAVAVASTAILATPQTEAQQRGAAPASGSGLVAVIDVAKVYKSHAGFKRKMEKVKREIQAFEADINRQRQDILKQRDKLTAYNSGSPEYKRIEESVARQMSELKVRMELKKKDILEREARIYFETYNEIVSAVQGVANRYGILLVLRYDSEQIDPQNRQSVLRGVNRPVVFQRNRDITNLVLNQFPAVATANRNNSGPAGQRK